MSAKARLAVRRAEMAKGETVWKKARKRALERREASCEETERIERIWREKFEEQGLRYYAEPALDRVGASNSSFTSRTRREIGAVIGRLNG